MSLGHHHRPVVAIAPSPRAQMYRGQRGFTMVMFGLMLVPLLLMVGLSVDVGYWYNRASDMQERLTLAPWPVWCGCPTGGPRRRWPRV